MYSSSKILIALILGLSSQIVAQNVKQDNSYQFFIDLTKVKNDQLEVELVSPKFNQNEVIYNIPKTVPGTYSNDDYGRYISQFMAYDKSGKKLKVNKLNTNSYKISKAKKLYKIKYKVDDSWDSPEIEGGHIFEPTGSNIEANTQFAINNHAFFGYFANINQNTTYNITFQKPEGFYGSTSLEASSNTATEERFSIPSYHQLIDAPILYSKPDTTMLNIAGTKILVSVVSPNKMAKSAEIAENIKTLLEAQKEYLGGKFPVDKYAFLIVLADVAGNSYGALEHSYSSFYYLPEASSEDLAQTIKDVASHEFFHIVTPLNIHAEQIADFDYNQPKMSKHLWMYEGLTEYAAGHMQIKHGLIDMPLYMNMIREKITTMKGQFKDNLPFTEMSAGVLDKYKDEYQNVYNKGALIGLCLDIKLRDLSKGKYGTQNLMRDLAKTYGKDKAFKDDELFDKITQLSGFPEIRQFFSQYVEGPNALPLADVFSAVGIIYAEQERVKAINLGNVSLSYNAASKRLIVASVSNINNFGRSVGYREGDELVSLNGKEISIETYQKVVGDFKETAKEGDPFEMQVMRKNTNGEMELTKLSAALVGSETTMKNVLRPAENPSESQLRLREYWLDPTRN
jgi:predicted metalloprotease with PDZ domain